LPEDPKERTNAALKKVTEALKGTDVAAIKSAVEELANESQQLGSALYAQTQADASAAGASADGPSANGSASQEEEIVDAEIVDEAEKK
jgi:molecular chaperone DnaK